MIFKLIVALITLLEGAQCLTVTTAPTNVTVKLGSDATIPCVVVKTSLETIDWKLPNGTVIASNTAVTNAAKYRVDGTFNLTILKTTKADEGGYTCASQTTVLGVGYLSFSGSTTTAVSVLLMTILTSGAASLNLAL